jgi:hypothetical protein
MSKYTLLILSILVVFAVSGCGTMPSVCDKAPAGESVLCDLSKQHDLNLEQIGTLVMVLNLRAIKNGSYSAQEASFVLEDIRDSLRVPTSAVDLKNLILAYVVDYPELILLSPYFSTLDTPRILTQRDRDMLTAWIDQQLALLK